MKGKDGNLLWNEMNIKYVKDENGCIIWLMWVGSVMFLC